MSCTRGSGSWSRSNNAVKSTGRRSLMPLMHSEPPDAARNAATPLSTFTRDRTEVSTVRRRRSQTTNGASTPSVWRCSAYPMGTRSRSPRRISGARYAKPDDPPRDHEHVGAQGGRGTAIDADGDRDECPDASVGPGRFALSGCQLALSARARRLASFHAARLASLACARCSSESTCRDEACRTAWHRDAR